VRISIEGYCLRQGVGEGTSKGDGTSVIHLCSRVLREEAGGVSNGGSTDVWEGDS